MHQWEDLRGTTGFLDWAAELTIDIDDIKDDANRAHDQASAAYHRAKTVEGEARDTCTAALPFAGLSRARSAHQSLITSTVAAGRAVPVRGARPASGSRNGRCRGHPTA